MGNIESLIGFIFASVKSFAGGVVYSRCLYGFATKIVIRFLTYNVAVIIKLKMRIRKI